VKILLAIDGSPCSDLAVAEVAERTWPPGSEIRVVSAIEPYLAIAPEPWILPPACDEQLENASRERARSLVEAAVARIRSGSESAPDVSRAIVIGTPRQVILDEAEEWGADLIVVGSHGYGAIERLLLGSVSLAVAQQAKCSVEIVRCRPAGE